MRNKKKQGERSFLYLLRYLFLGGIIGMIGSMFFNGFFTNIGENSLDISSFFLSNSQTILYGIIIVFALFGGWTYVSGKKELLQSLKEERDILEDKKINASLHIFSLGSLLILFAFALYAQYITREELYSMSLINSILMIVSIVAFAVMEKKIIKTIKSVYPEKEGDPYELSFYREWEESMDEREKIDMYYAGFKTYKTLNMSSFGMILLLTFLGTHMEIQMLTYGITLFFILVGNITYIYHSMKGKKKWN